MFLSDSLPSEMRFRQAYTLSLYLSVMGRVSPVPNYTFHTYRFLYTEGFFRAVFQFLHTFHGFRLFYQGSTSLFFSFETFFNDTAEFTLCYGLHDCSHLFQGYFIHSLSTLYYYNAPSLATRLTGDYRDRTFTGKCGPASLDTRHKKRPCPFGHSQMPKNLEKRKSSADIYLRRTIFLSISILSSTHFHCNPTYLPMLCQFTTYLLPFFFQSFLYVFLPFSPPLFPVL